MKNINFSKLFDNNIQPFFISFLFLSRVSKDLLDREDLLDRKDLKDKRDRKECQEHVMTWYGKISRTENHHLKV